jgi:hypothetical protein
VSGTWRAAPDEAGRAQPAGTLWVASRLGDDGRYAVQISLGGTRLAWQLDPTRGLRYARAVLRVAQLAEHDSAVIRQLAALGTPVEAAAELLARDLRPERAPLDDQATRPLLFRPIVAVDGLVPIVQMEWPPQPELGHRAAQLTARAAAGHAASVLEVAFAVELDDAYARMLVGVLGLPELRARALIDDLPRFREGVEGVEAVGSAEEAYPREWGDQPG